MRATVFVAAAALACAACPRPIVPPPEPKPEVVEDPGPPPIVVPRREGPPVVVLPIQPVRAALFSPELLRLERWIARHLGVQQELVLDPVPPEEVEALRLRIAAGRVSEDGPRCLAAIPVRAAVEHAWPKAHRAYVRADCSAEPCRLIVDVFPPEGAESTAGVSWTANVEGAASFADWEKAAKSLRPAPPPEERKPAPPPPTETTAGNDERVVVSHVVASGDWSASERPTAKDFALPERPALRECHPRGQTPSGPTLLVLDFAKDGRLTACGAHGWRDPPLGEQLGCYCRALEGVKVAEGAADRRLAVELLEVPDVDHLISSTQRITARIEDFRSNDPAIRQHWLTSALPWVAMCFGETRLTDELVMPVKFTLDARGQVTDAQFGGLERSEVLANCVTGYLRNVVMPCPFGGTAELEFTVRVRREEVPQPQRPAATTAPPARRR